MDRALYPAIFLDRDGVINEAIVKDGLPYPPRDLTEFQFCDDIDDLMFFFFKKNFKVFVVTNQPDVKRGQTSLELVEKLNYEVQKKFPLITEISTCFHDDSDNCKCRKPLPGMVNFLAEKHQIDCKKSYLIGDRSKDIECGFNAGCKTIFIDRGYKEQLKIKPNLTVTSLTQIKSYLKTSV